VKDITGILSHLKKELELVRDKADDECNYWSSRTLNKCIALCDVIAEAAKPPAGTQR